MAPCNSAALAKKASGYRYARLIAVEVGVKQMTYPMKARLGLAILSAAGLVLPAAAQQTTSVITDSGVRAGDGVCLGVVTLAGDAIGLDVVERCDDCRKPEGGP